jgi:hypothetical protein
LADDAEQLLHCFTPRFARRLCTGQREPCLEIGQVRDHACGMLASVPLERSNA